MSLCTVLSLFLPTTLRLNVERNARLANYCEPRTPGDRTLKINPNPRERACVSVPPTLVFLDYENDDRKQKKTVKKLFKKYEKKRKTCVTGARRGRNGPTTTLTFLYRLGRRRRRRRRLRWRRGADNICVAAEVRWRLKWCIPTGPAQPAGSNPRPNAFARHARDHPAPYPRYPTPLPDCLPRRRTFHYIPKPEDAAP